MVFPALFLLGFFGLAGMWLAGATHRHHHGHHGHTAHGRLPGRGLAKGHVPAARALASAKQPDILAPRTPQKSSRLLAAVLQLMSPLTLAALLLGVGAAGTVAMLLGAGLIATYVAAAAGGVVMRFAVVGPIANTIFRFESPPAQNLEGCLLQEVVAITRFNRRGEGLVRVQFDGREEDVLARLVEKERNGARVDRGERLIIEEIDPRRNQCVVSRANPVLTD